MKWFIVVLILFVAFVASKEMNVDNRLVEHCNRVYPDAEENVNFSLMSYSYNEPNFDRMDTYMDVVRGICFVTELINRSYIVRYDFSKENVRTNRNASEAEGGLILPYFDMHGSLVNVFVPYQNNREAFIQYYFVFLDSYITVLYPQRKTTDWKDELADGVRNYFRYNYDPKGILGDIALTKYMIKEPLTW
mgnify:CR=1 FL=1